MLFVKIGQDFWVKVNLVQESTPDPWNLRYKSSDSVFVIKNPIRPRVQMILGGWLRDRQTTDDRQTDDRRTDDRQTDDRQTDDRQTDDRQTDDRQTDDRQTNRQTNRQINRQTNIKTDKQTNRQTDKQTNRLQTYIFELKVILI